MKQTNTGLTVITPEAEVINALFENREGLLRPKAVTAKYGISTATIYDWRYRSHEYRIPKGLFVKLGRRLFIRSEMLKSYLADQVEIVG